MLKKILTVVLILVITFILIGVVYVRVCGKTILEEVLSQSLQRQIQIGTIAYQFPFGARVEDVRIDKDFSAREVLVQFAPETLAAQSRRIKQLIINAGQYHYVDRSKDSLQFRVEDIHLAAQDILVPLAPGRIPFNFTGRLAQENNPLNDSQVQGGGWLDWINRDMEGTLQVTDSSGHIGLHARAVSENNNMSVMGGLNIGGTSSSSRTESPAGIAAQMKNIIFDALAIAGVDVEAKFSFTTKMDNFQIGNIAFSSTVTVGEGLGEIFSR